MTIRNWSIGLVVLGASSLLADHTEAQDVGLPADQAATSPANPLAGTPISDVRSFQDRPLFVASRRNAIVPPKPPAALAVAPPPTPPSAANLRLLGTMSTSTGVSALIQDTGRGTTETVGDGETIDRWRIAEIQASKVRLESGGQSVWLEIFGPAAPVATAPASASSRPAAGQTNQVVSPSPPAAATVTPPPAVGAAPPGTIAGTAAAAAAAASPYRLTFGTAEPRKAD